VTRTYSITELAQDYALTPRAIRFYEDRGLLKPRRQGQTRVYREGDRVRLGLILRGKSLGFSLDEIAELLDLYKIRDGGVEQTIRTLDRVADRIATLERRRQDIDAALGDLRGVEAELRQRLCELEAVRTPTRSAAQ